MVVSRSHTSLGRGGGGGEAGLAQPGWPTHPPTSIFGQ